MFAVNKTQQTMTERTLRKIRGCSGNCMKCEQCDIKTANTSQAIVYAFYCKIADKAGYRIYSNRASTLRNDTVQSLEFELDVPQTLLENKNERN